MEYGIPKLGFLVCGIRYRRTVENSDTAIARFLSGEYCFCILRNTLYDIDLGCLCMSKFVPAAPMTLLTPSFSRLFSVPYKRLLQM